MGTNHLFKNVRTLAMALTLCAAAAATMLVACQKDTTPETPKVNLTLNCAVKEVYGEYTTFNVDCESDYAIRYNTKFFYADTVPYSRNKDEQNIRRRGAKMVPEEEGKYNFIPRFEYSRGCGYDLKEGEMIAIHSLDDAKKYYIGAYVVFDNDTVWSEPYVYDTPQSLKLNMEITTLTAHDVTFKVKFSRPAGSDIFAEDLTCVLCDCSEEVVKDRYLTLTPFPGEVTALEGSFDNLVADREYLIFLPYKTRYMAKEEHAYVDFRTTAAN